MLGVAVRERSFTPRLLCRCLPKKDRLLNLRQNNEDQLNA